MPEVANIWIAGCAVRHQEAGPEYLRPVNNHRTGAFQSWPIEQGFHNGFNSIYRIAPGRDVWFHFAIPTPVSLAGIRPLYLDHTVILWSVAEGVVIQCVATIHRGAGRFVLSDRVQTGEHLDGPDSENVYPLKPRLRMDFGLQLSILARAVEQEGEVRFVGAGASFWDTAE